MTVCQDKEGTDESTRRAADWVAQNIEASVSAPSIAEGDTAVQF